jgi:predicted RNA-binding Zn-ribbon protein involved in translation (DUF1610 family)
MSLKHYQLYCDSCNYKRITDGTDIQDLIPVKTSSIQQGIPYIDPLTKKTVTPPYKPQKLRFKCPKCGKVIMARQITFIEDTNEADNAIGRETSPEGFTLS